IQLEGPTLTNQAQGHSATEGRGQQSDPLSRKASSKVEGSYRVTDVIQDETYHLATQEGV
ncbi:hypothetical protein B296_00030127, partial [Ensete ventricosum]